MKNLVLTCFHQEMTGREVGEGKRENISFLHIASLILPHENYMVAPYTARALH